MKKNTKELLEKILDIHSQENYLSHKGSVIILLKEFGRRMILWKKLIRENNMNIDIGGTILFDVVEMIMNVKVDINETEKIILDKVIKNKLSYYDIMIINAYLNWMQQKDEIRKMGYDLPSPYEPYIEIFKRGGYFLKYSYKRLEVYPFWGVIIDPIQDFLTNRPFTTLNKEILDLADEE